MLVRSRRPRRIADAGGAAARAGAPDDGMVTRRGAAAIAGRARRCWTSAATCRGRTARSSRRSTPPAAREWQDALRDVDRATRSSQQTYPRAAAVRPAADTRRRTTLWQTLEASVAGAVDRDFVRVLANDCLASLPPLTFFQDAVVDRDRRAEPGRSGSNTARCARWWTSAACSGSPPAGASGTSTLERFAHRAQPAAGARSDLPRGRRDAAHRALAAGARRHQPGHDGAELPPALLSRHDRQLLKSGFRSIHAAARVHRRLVLARSAVTGRRSSTAIGSASTRRGATTRPSIRSASSCSIRRRPGSTRASIGIITIGAVAVQDGEIVLDDAFDALIKVDENTSAVTVHGVTRDESRAGLEEPRGAGTLPGLSRRRRDRRSPHRSRHHHVRHARTSATGASGCRTAASTRWI